MYRLWSSLLSPSIIMLICDIINPRRACAARVTVVVLCVCLSVCLSDYSRTTTTLLALRATRRLMSDTNRFSATRAGKNKGDFAETTAFERYGVKTS